MSLQFKKIDTLEKLLQILLKYDDSATRTISSRVADMKGYAEKLFCFAWNYEVCDENDTVGFFSFYANDKIEKTAYLTIIAVDAEFRNCGVGSKILWYMQHICRENEMQRIRLEVDTKNQSAVCFYKKNGFKQVTDASADSFFMEKEI